VVFDGDLRQPHKGRQASGADGDRIVTRRRLLRLVVVVAVVAAPIGALVALISSNGGASTEAPAGPPVVTIDTPDDVPLSAATRRGINRTLDVFVPDAVRRDDPARAFALTTDSFRGDTTRASWSKGSLPVMPYPAVGRHFHGWRLDFSNGNSVGLELELQPSDPSKVGLVAFSIVLQRQHGRWLIDAFAPVATFQPSGSGADIRAAPDYSPAARGSANGEQTLSKNWILLPVAVLGAPFVALIVFAPIALVRSRRRRPAPGEQLDEYYRSIGRMRDPTDTGTGQPSKP
jgi:hypothetical protein